MLPEWLDPATLEDVILGGMIVFGLLALLVLRFVGKILTKLVLIGGLVGLGAVMYVERDSLSDCAAKCTCEFLWFDVDVPACSDRLETS